MRSSKSCGATAPSGGPCGIDWPRSSRSEAIATRAQEITQFLAACWRWYPNAPKEMSKDFLSRKIRRGEERLVDGDGRLRSFRDGCCDKKNVARHVAGNIYAGDTSLLCISVHHDATLRIPLAAKTLRKVRCLMAAGREE